MFSLAGQRQGLAARWTEAKTEGRTLARGFLSGIMWGGLLSLAVAGTVSVFSDGPTSPEVASQAPTVDAAQEQDSPPPTPSPAAESQPTPTPAAPEVVEATEPDSPATVPDTAPIVAPDADQQGTAQPAPAEPTEQGGVDVAAETPAPTIPQSTVPTAPESDSEISVSTESAPVPEPQVSEPEQSDATAEVELETAALAPESEPTPPAATAEEIVTAPEADPVPTVQGEAEPAAPQTAEPEQPAPAEQPVTEAEPESDTGVGKPASDLDALAPQVKTNRLPSLGDDPEPAPEEATEADVAVVEFDPDLPPIQRYAAPFENPEAKPLMAIVLIDDGSGIAGGTAGAEALSAFPYPITFAVDASLPDAADKMERYRGSGFEVMALVNLPENSTASDTEVSMSVALNAVPQAVAVLEGPGTGIQGNREMANQVTAILADFGLGLVTQPKGLNTVQKLASRSGVPAATLFRDFDSQGQDSVVIRRFLDQAAFKAGQEGGVIMVGRLRPDTVSALLLWGLQDRAGRVALVPVSAVLTSQ